MPTPAAPAPRRRRRGEPRRLLLEAARELFNRKGYAGTTTREIAEQAGVSETLIYRYFQSKAGLFKEATVVPFVEVLDRAVERHMASAPQINVTWDDTRAFVASLYDVFHIHRALAALLFVPDASDGTDLAASGAIDDVRAAIDRFVRFAADAAVSQGTAIEPGAHELAIRGHIAMVASMATFGPWYFGAQRPSRRAVVDEMSEWVWIRYNATPAPTVTPAQSAPRAGS